MESGLSGFVVLRHNVWLVLTSSISSRHAVYTCPPIFYTGTVDTASFAVTPTARHVEANWHLQYH